MKSRDAVLFGLPVAAILLFVVCVVFLCWQTSSFEKAYKQEAKNNIAQESGLVAAILTPMLNEGKAREAVQFCNQFDKDNFRITLIDASGKVAADSAENSAFLENHLEREEVKSALAGTPTSVVRYSESLGQWMMYHALPLKTKSGTYVLRAAISTDQVQDMINLSRLNMFWALLFGGEIVLILSIYILTKIRKPLLALQKNLSEIASGRLDTRIDIPESGIVREFALSVSSMTDQLRKQLSTVTAERNERKILLDAISEGVMLFASDGTLLQANPEAADIFEFSSADERFHLSRCRIPDLLDLAQKAFLDGQPFEHEFTLRRQGVLRFLFIRGRVLEYEGSKRLLLAVIDLTNLRKLESFRTDFVANVSHEIKTPLTCILGAVETMEEEPDMSKAQRSKLMDILSLQSQRLNSLVQDILSLAALEKQQTEPSREFTEVTLDSVVANAANLCANSVSAAKMNLVITENIPLRIQGDAALLEQAVVNLIENAVRYSEGKTIELSLTQQGPFAVISVRDDGIGIPPEHRDRIFERFYRVDKSRSRQLGGTGLGLAIVKHIAQLHGGVAELKCGEGKGCEFLLRFPL